MASSEQVSVAISEVGASEADVAPAHHGMVRDFAKKFRAPSNETSPTLIWDDARRQMLGTVLREAIFPLFARQAARVGVGDAGTSGQARLRVSPETEWDFSLFLSRGSYADLYFKESSPVIVPDPSLPSGVSSSGEEAGHQPHCLQGYCESICTESDLKYISAGYVYVNAADFEWVYGGSLQQQ